MRVKIFAEAIRLQEFLEEYGTTHNKIHFRFVFPNEEEILTELFIEKNCSRISCTCKHGSINFDALCSHKLACVFYFFRQQMRKLKQKW